METTPITIHAPGKNPQMYEEMSVSQIRWYLSRGQRPQDSKPLRLSDGILDVSLLDGRKMVDDGL